MGRYIQTKQLHGKAEEICREYGAVRVSQGEALSALQEGLGVICVVDNGPFEAAAYAFDEKEFDVFTQPIDFRPKTWLIMDKAKAEALAS